MYSILEFPDGPALSVGYRTLASAEAALDRLRTADSRYRASIVVPTQD